MRPGVTRTSRARWCARAAPTSSPTSSRPRRWAKRLQRACAPAARTSTMRVVLTRPVQEAERWAARLRERGVESLVLPLLAIHAAPDPEALRAAAASADRYAALMFVSANAVQGFF